MAKKLTSESSTEIENELKLKLADVVVTRDRIRNLGSIYTLTENQKDTYFQRSNPEDRIIGENIRVRTVFMEGCERYGYLTYKSPLDDNSQFLRRDEFETRVNDPRMVLEILDRLGYEVIDEIEKTREVYRFENLHIGLDHVEGLGHFIEIEGSDAEIISFAEQLGLDPGKAINKSYSAMRDKKNKK